MAGIEDHPDRWWVYAGSGSSPHERMRSPDLGSWS